MCKCKQIDVYVQSTSAVISGRYKCVIRTRITNVWLNANVRPQETTEAKYNGPVEDKKYYLSIKKSYTCCSFQDKCFHLIFFIRQSNTDFTLFDGCCQEELDHNTYLARWLQKMTKRIFLITFQVTHIQRWLWSFVLWCSPPSPRHSGTCWHHGHSASGFVASSVGSCCRNHPHWSGYRQRPWPTSDDLVAVPQSWWCTCSWQRCWLAPFHWDCRWWWWGRMAGLEQNIRYKIRRTKHTEYNTQNKTRSRK